MSLPWGAHSPGQPCPGISVEASSGKALREPEEEGPTYPGIVGVRWGLQHRGRHVK